MSVSKTLKIRNLPPDLSNVEKTDLIKHFGAQDVKCIGTKNPTAFAKFESEEAAKIALKRLHQLDVLGYNLNVVYCHTKPKEGEPVESDATNMIPSSTKDEKNNEDDGTRRYETFLQKLNAWSLGIDLSQPPPAHLRYQYPPPTVETLANIARAMCAVPKFYTQVLHLMNKMNLPSPFHGTCEEHRIAMSRLLGHSKPPVTEDEPAFEAKQAITEELEMQLGSSTSESELESETDEPKQKEIIPEKRPRVQKKQRKRPRLVLNQPDKSIQKSNPSELSLEEVFEVAARSEQKKIEMKLRTEDNKKSEESNEMSEQESGFGILFPPVPENIPEDENKKKEEDLDGSYISVSLLKANRIPERDRDVLSVYRGYQAGAPTCRLYIKNLAKTVTERDLHFIFRAFLGHKPTDKEANEMFDIRLMKEGRMKGQAFVTYPNVSQATSALRETNGYILKDKPMVVQYARSAKPSNAQ